TPLNAGPSTASTPPVATATAAPFGAATSGTSSGTFTAGGATIQADTTNNALVIMAPEPIYNNIRAVVEKLDIRRAQVYVEALIVEVSADKVGQFGVQWNLLNPNAYNTNATQVAGGTNFNARGSGQNILDAQVNLNSVGPGLNLGIIKGSITIPGIGTITNLALLAQALETDSKANI